MHSPITSRTRAIAPLFLLFAASSCHSPPSTLADDPPEVVATAAAARASSVRNADPELLRIAIPADDVTALTAFLRALDEDYD